MQVLNLSYTFLMLFSLAACCSLPTSYCLLPAARCQLGSATFPLTFMNLWSNFQCSLGDRLAVGRMTLDHATGVRILLPQPVEALNSYTLFVIRYWEEHRLNCCI